MSDLYIKVKSAGTTGWQRPAEWLPLPTVTNINTRIFYGLFLVFENEFNALRISIGGAPTVDWGDGTPPFTYSSAITKIYDYDSITGAVNQYYDGRNYKQVIISVINFSTEQFSLDLLDSTNNIRAYSTLNFADIYMSWGLGNNTEGINFNRLGNRILPYLEIFKFRNYNAVGIFRLEYCTNLKIIEFSNGTSVRVLHMRNSIVDGIFNRPTLITGNIDQINNLTTNLGNENFIGGQPFDAIYRFFLGKKIGNITAFSNSGFSGRSMFRNTRNLEEIGLINTPNFSNFESAFRDAPLIREIIFSNFQNVTSVTNMFTNTGSITKLITPGCTIGIDITNNSMTKEAIEAWFDSLGTANGTQTITITGNPGASTCDTTIATNKGFTVVI